MASMDDVFYGPGQRERFEVTEDTAGHAGTTWRSAPEILLTIQSGSLVVCIVLAMAAKIYLEFLLVPLILAYFVTFLLAPIMDVVENRPYTLPGEKVMCANKFASLDLWEPKQGKFPLEYYRKLPADYTPEEINGKMTGQQIWKAPEDDEIEKRSVMTTEMWEAAKDRANLPDGPACLADLLQTWKLPHMMAVLFCLTATGCILYAIVLLITTEFAAFGEKEAQAVAMGDASIAKKLTDMANGQIEYLEANAVKVYRELVCPRKDLSTVTLTVNMGSDDTLGNYVDFEINGVESLKAQIDNVTHGGFDHKSDNCYRKPVFGSQCTYSNPNEVARVNGKILCTAAQIAAGAHLKRNGNNDPAPDCFSANPVAPYQKDYCNPYADMDSFDEFMGTVGMLGDIVNLLVLVLLLALYILLERPQGRTISGDHIIMEEIENMVKSYIVMKTMLSVLTGGLSGVCLAIAGVPMAGVFGLLSFLLNYIPSVGSMIAMVLPIPIILLDPALEANPTMFYLALCGPVAVQGYIGNVLEPAVFGASLNLTALAILMALIFYGAVWGLSGAVISVPLLGAAKIVLHHTDHPMAQYTLMMLREDPSIP